MLYLLTHSGESVFTSKLNRWFTEQRSILFATLNYSQFLWNDVIPMLHQSKLQFLYESKKGTNIELLKDRNGLPLYYKNVAYNSLAVSNVPPPAFDLEKHPIEQTKLSKIFICHEYYPFVWLLCIGKFYVSKWLTYGDDFDLTGKDIMDFSFPFDALIEDDKKQLLKLYEKVKKELPDTTQFKLNVGKYVGTFNTKKLWHLTDKGNNNEED